MRWIVLCWMMWLQLCCLKGVCGRGVGNPMTFPTDAPSSTAECLTEAGHPGVCQHLEDCPSAKDAISAGINPKICSWKGMVPVICCAAKPRQPYRPPPTRPTPFRTTPGTVVAFDGGTKECGVKLKPGDVPLRSASRLFKSDDALTRALQETFRNIPRTTLTEEHDNWPWMVAIFSTAETGQVHICGGVLIPTGKVLTAAHCFLGRSTKPSDYVVRVGGSSIYEGYIFTVQGVTLHPDYRSNMNYHDLAILHLADDAAAISGIVPICLPSAGFNTEQLVRRRATVLGWDDATAGKERNRMLQAVEGLPIIATRDCNATYFNLSIAAFQRGIDNNFICAAMAYDRREVPCQDASGGPLMIQLNGRWTLLGFVTFGYSCAVAEYPGVYTRISSYVEWIQRAPANSDRFSREVEADVNALDRRGIVYPYERIIFS